MFKLMSRCLRAGPGNVIYYSSRCFAIVSPLPSNRQRYEIDDCLEDNRENY